MMRKFLKVLLLLFVLVVAAALFWGYPTYMAVYGPNVPKELDAPYLHIPTGADYNELLDSLRGNGFLVDEAGFRKVASLMKFDERHSVRAGRFKLVPGMSNRELIQLLRAGKQSPLNLTISYGRLPEDVAGRASRYIEADSLEILAVLVNRDRLAKEGLKPETALTRIIPNTYEFFWNTDGAGFWERMKKEHDRFWTEDRKAKAKRLGMNTEKVYTLASIVEAETQYVPEMPRVAGVYINRLEDGMLLQADPTVIYALGDFSIKRVLNKDKEHDSPYNTYKYTGLPPGPIRLASVQAIDAVLNYEVHDYYYFCAKPPKDLSQRPKEHAFARTLAQHNANAQRYYAYLKKVGIYR